jgi:hypothetical protein
VEVIGLKVPIPYNWWILLIIGAAIVLMEILAQVIMLGTITGINWIIGGILIGLAGLVELLIGGGKLTWSASKFVLLFGAALTITIALIGWVLIWSILAIVLSVILILMLFEVIPNQWWYVLGVGIAVFFLIHPIGNYFFQPGGAVLLVGFILVLMDK